MDDIDLPMTKGTMEDITQENEASSQPDGSTETPTDSMSSQGAKRIYEKEANILIDYGRLDDDLKEVITVSGLKFPTLFLFLFSNKMLVIRAVTL